ncbi:MAG: DEAD/DEAH box helicase, partial [Solirubrobacteraceae bacterium]
MFRPAVQSWLESAFAAPTKAQLEAWPQIASGSHVLLSAPTGSGKTLAAFLSALDRLSDPAECGGGTRVLYVSPLKALAYDIERNLRTPIRGIGAEHISVGIRTGDTPQKERAAMIRKPPDILVTTPESLYLLLTSQAREMLKTVDTAIVDEIHAVAGSKRGSHLAITLERLEKLVRDANPEIGPEDSAFQRIGLSATQNPLAEIGRYLVGPRREVKLVDAGVRKQLDLRIEVPVESMTEPGAGAGGAAPDPLAADGLTHLAGGEATRASIWPAIYPEVLKLVKEHTSTIVFVNNRRSAERIALRLNELASKELQDEDGNLPEGVPPVEIARAHHGSLAREERTKVEELLKSGGLPCLVATSSLELGIDMGAVDLVLQIESPKSVARGLQRIGRAGHGVDQVSRGRIFPKYRGDLLECAVVVRRMREGAIEPTVVPRNALDVLAQQVVAIVVSAEGPEADGVTVDEIHALVTATHSYSELSRELLENVLDMLDGRYPSKEFGELRARIVWD